ncbi:MAG: T9SS type A sorting domain-containing protein [Saprospiraceae bacterium]|nr:T9SS type A sorting domain-containing protein [Saprospiraceae bacterium]
MKKCPSLLFFGIFILIESTPAAAQISFAPLPTQPPDHILSIANDTVHHIMYACTSTRVQRSFDQGITWDKTANTGAFGINTLFVTASGQLYAGVEMTVSGAASGLVAYNQVTNTWSAVPGAPNNISAIIELPNGDLAVGTGSSANFQPNAINIGTGIYRFQGGSWVAENAGLPMLPGFNNLPYIKGFAITTDGEWYAATYGCGVLHYQNGSWQDAGLGLVNASSILAGQQNTLFVGLDNGVARRDEAGNWTLSSGLPAKPARALVQATTGKLYAGLGYYVWMNGSLAGEIYTSSDDGLSWQKSDGGLRTSDVLCLKCVGTHCFAGAAGLWQTVNAGQAWSSVNSPFWGSNQAFSVHQNAAGHLFAACDNQPKFAGYGGIFRSTDEGQTWEQILTGINRHRCNFLFCDSQGNLWAGFTRFVGTASNGSHTDGVLYKSVDNGETWQQNTGILTPTLRFSGMKESPTGKLYVINGWGGPSNISASSDYEHWDNSLNGGMGNGGMAFGLAVNQVGDVFVGTETQGIMRSLSNGTAPFETVSPIVGNSSVFVDASSGYVFAGGGGSANGLGFWASVPADNGANMFQFEQFPVYTYPVAMVFDNRGNLYMTSNSAGFANAGFYIASGPWHAGSSFSKVMANANVSYYFTSMFIDPCGYIYGAQNGIYKSDVPVNTPPAPVLQNPGNGTLLQSMQVAFAWQHSCTPDQFRVQVSTDSLFSALLIDTLCPTNTFNGDLPGEATYYWRVQAINAAGDGSWSAVFHFSISPAMSGVQGPAELPIRVYPNPAQTTITLESSVPLSGARLLLYDSTGKQRWEGVWENQVQQISLEHLPSGVYGLVVGSAWYKFVKN